jgi:ribonuclease III
MRNLSELEQRLGVSFRDPSLLAQALRHTSFINEHLEAGEISNERLEFLGDAVLGLAVSERMYRRFPESEEGELTRGRSQVVCNEMLHRLALELGLGDYLELGRGEEMSGGRRKPSNLARATEAIFGAVFLDRGFRTAKRVIIALLSDEINPALVQPENRDDKTRLQEFLQGQGRAAPRYRVVCEEGLAHEKIFFVEATLDGETIGAGSGRTKKLAESGAAAAARRKLIGD